MGKNQLEENSEVQMMDEEILKKIYLHTEIADDLNIIPYSPKPDSDICQTISFNLLKDSNIINSAPLERKYFSSKKLRSKSNDEIGKVAEHKLLVLNEEYRGGRGRAIHDKEFEVYRDETLFDEIQVDAAWAGIIAWRRIGLDYTKPDTEKNIFHLFYIPYLKKIKKFTGTTLIEATRDMKDNGIKEVSKENLKHQMDLDEIIRMYPSELADLIKHHYQLFYSKDSGQVEFGLAEFIRFTSFQKNFFLDNGTVPMHRKVS